jgi:putative ABC transport system substrate-binding protein
MSTELGAKRLALMYELLPRATSFAVLINPDIPNIESAIKGMQAAAAAIGRPIEILTASTGRELDTTFVL